MTYIVRTKDDAWSYVVSDDENLQPAPYRGPWRYRWEAQEYADELNAKNDPIPLCNSAPVVAVQPHPTRKDLSASEEGTLESGEQRRARD
jgi:hypothetical protein